jgi:HK97 family phage major capsid protein
MVCFRHLEIGPMYRVTVDRKGIDFARAAVAFALGRTDADAAHIALQRWGEQGAPYVVVKAAVAAIGMNAGDAGVGLASPLGAQEFVASVQQGAIIGRLLGRPELPLNTRTLAITSGATAHWVKAKSPKPVSRLSLAGETLPPLKTAALIVTTREVVQRSDPKTEARFNADLQRACVELLDQTFIDPANSGVADESPASITSGATPIASSGNPATDVAALVEAFDGDLASAYFITDPTTATGLAMARDASGSFMFPDVGPRGGSLLGIPLLTSRSSPRDSSGGILVLLDASAVGVGVEGARVARSEQATLQMNDAPDDPPTATSVQVSLWQSGLVAFLVELFANWKLARSGAVALVTGANYPTDAP